jgi:hypothetical protein
MQRNIRVEQILLDAEDELRLSSDVSVLDVEAIGHVL